MFWFFYGLFVGAGSMRLLIWVAEGSIKIPWYGWTTGIITFLLATLALQTFFASFQEREPRAAWMSLVFIGVPALILSTITIMTVSWA
jgi:hypothetical protein